MLIDSHCHLNRLKDLDLDQIVQNAKSRQIEKILSVAVSLEEVSELKEIAQKYDNVFYSVGKHPSEFEGEDSTVEKLIELSNDKKCVALGETGLDYHYNDESTFNDQKRRFIAHIEAAKVTKKPVIVHTRAAREDTINILKAHANHGVKGVLHCFTETWELAKFALDLGFYISFSGIITFKNAEDLRDIAKKLPLDRILVETDAPYLTPVPFRGKPNYPEYVYYVAEFLANHLSIPFEEFARQTKENTNCLFFD